ncbi:MAG: glycosyl transferase group 1 [Chloroflexi bacterium]|nr:glycosyl transferase group 1 [Chloroflexota bacterium]
MSQALTHLDLGVVSTYPPREDGIATFTRDLLDAVSQTGADIAPRIAAITDPGSYYNYPPEVVWQIEQGEADSYTEAGRALQEAGVSVISLQHEFGLFGIWGEPLVDFTPYLLEPLTKPLVTTLHTVLSQPRADIREAVRQLCARSAATVVMVRVGAKILVEDYGVDADSLRIIPHGAPSVAPVDPERAKVAVRLGGHVVLSTFGLLSRGKGIENAIRALPSIVEQHPNCLYMVMGETHPQVRRQEGESYRQELAELARELNVHRHVRFINEYLRQESLIRYLQATDVYITPYRDRNQITSGTLSYALGCGRATVSTAYTYAAEALAEGRGLLAEFDSPDSIARSVSLYLDDPSFRAKTEERALEYGKQMSWPNVGQQYAELFREVAEGAAR